MRFLSVAERELRAAARRPGLYRLRWYTAVGFFVLLLWLGWLTGAFKSRGGASLFEPFAVLVFLYSLLVGATGASDCLSRERREGTLGLLFLTNLNSAEIIAGKLIASLLGAVYPLLAILPILALPVLLGGITAGQLGRTMLALVNAIFFAVAAGLVSSALCVRQFPAVALATGLALAGGVGISALAAALSQFPSTRWFGDAVGVLSPLTTLMLAEERTPKPAFWRSLATVAGVSWTGLALVTWWVARSWRDRPTRAHFWSGWSLGSGWQARRRAARQQLRARFLAVNPLFWLASRTQLGSSVFMVLTLAVVGVTLLGTVPLFTAIVPAGAVSPVASLVFGWIIATLALHLLALYYAAMGAAQRLAEDRQTGSLELILSTPTSERSISRGLWLAFARQMAFPAVVLVLAHGFLLWLIALVMFMEDPEKYPPGFTTGQWLWHVLFNVPIHGQQVEWAVVFVVHVSLVALGLLFTSWVTLGWVGRWLGVRLKHPGFAPLASLALVFAPPALLCGLLCYAFDEWGITRIPGRRLMPLMLWLACGLGLMHCLIVSSWAAGRLRRDLRALVAGSLERRPRWWLPRARTVLRGAGATAAAALLIGAGLLGFQTYEDWRSRRGWAAFQKEIQQRGASLDLAALLPGPVPDEQNFAQSEAFQDMLKRASKSQSSGPGLASLYNFSRVELPPMAVNRELTAWLQQQRLNLELPRGRLTSAPRPAQPPERAESAAAVCAALAAQAAFMPAVADAAATRPRFQITTNRTAEVVLQANARPLETLAEAHVLFQLRATARLASGQPAGAAEDVLTSLRLANLAGQAPDASSTPHAQTLLVRSLQPLWEGLIAHQWNGPQLAAFQTELGRFNFLAAHTNAVRRFTLAHIEGWRTMPDSGAAKYSVRQSGGYVRQAEWAWQPRGWWFDNCIQLYRAGEKVIGGVDVAGGRVTHAYDWNDFEGLPLDSPTQMLLEQNWWSPGPALVAFAQTALNQAVTACALERYRLAQGSYPETLEALVPAYLAHIPPDCLRGRPLFYLRESADRFTLLGFGLNGVNDRGQATTDDWVWAFPALPTNAPPAKLKP